MDVCFFFTSCWLHLVTPGSVTIGPCVNSSLSGIQLKVTVLWPLHFPFHSKGESLYWMLLCVIKGAHYLFHTADLSWVKWKSFMVRDAKGQRANFSPDWLTTVLALYVVSLQMWKSANSKNWHLNLMSDWGKM